ncbi:MAG: alpha/beta hydrolase [Acidimicrobiia bacterium]|nr:alpha/beta hydrolase [Acidimicrobiia bacterium]
MSVPTIEGITAHTITTSRLATRVLTSGPDDGVPVLFLHGNVSSATWWEETMLRLPAGFRGIALDQRGFGEADAEALVDATRGAGDFADDAVALMDHLGHERFHLVGSSLGGVIAWWLLAGHSQRIISLTLADPGSPYGFGGTKDAEGTPTTDDYAGSGGGLINPELVRLIGEGDTSTDSMFSPRAALRALVWKPPFIPKREDEFVAALLQTHLGEDAYPGDKVMSSNWPFVAPGAMGVNNAVSPKYALDVSRIIGAAAKPRVLWVRGAQDLTVSNTAAADPGTWGPMGLVPGFPGAEAYPQQPMLDQIRKVLDDYTAAGGSYSEIVIDDCGHVPFIEKPEEFDKVFHAQIASG